MKIIKDSKLLLKIFSGFIAIVLWFAVTYTEDPAINQHLGRLDTVFYNEEALAQRGLIVVDKDELPSLSVTIRGKRSKVISSLDRVFAGIDVEKITSVGKHEVDVSYSYPDSDVSLSKEKHPTVTLNVEKLITKDIPVKINAKESKKHKDQLIESTPIESLTISGAQSFVSKISYASVEIDEADISSNSTVSYAYSFYDAKNNKLVEKNLYSKNREVIPVTHTFYDKTELPVKVVLSEDLRDDYTLKISNQDVTKLTVGISDDVDIDTLEVVFDSKDLESEDGSVYLQVQAPDGVYIPNSSQKIKIEYNLSKKSAH